MCDGKASAGFIAPVEKGFGKQEKGGKQGGKSKGKGKLHKGHVFQPERGEQRRFGGYCKWCWRIGHKEAQCWLKQEHTRSNPPQDPLQRDIRDWTNPAEKGRASPREREKKKAKKKTQEKEGAGQRRLNDFGKEHDKGYEITRADRTAFVFCVHSCKNVMSQCPEVPSSSVKVLSGVEGSEEPAGIRPQERCFVRLDVETSVQLLTLEVLCPRAQWITQRRFPQKKSSTA